MNIDNSFIILVLMGAMAIGYNHMKSQYDIISNKLDSLEKSKTLKQNIEKNEIIDIVRNKLEIEQKIDLNRDRDYRALADPMYPPLQRNPEFRDPEINRRINIKTRGDGGPYQQVGSIHKTTNINQDGVSPGSNTETYVLPLFGKPTYNGSNHWNYYTVTNNNVKIPISVNNTDCTDERGCNELEENATLNLEELNGEFKVKKYNFDKPRYIPYV
jgi:hypothetical protein